MVGTGALYLAIPPFGLPRDGAQWVALALAVVALVAGKRLFAATRRPRLFVALVASAAAALSVAYIIVYLRCGPRIIDATSYYLEGRALAEGLFSFPLRAPETAVLGRFLVRSQHEGSAHAAVIFPPGYPALLALGFLAHAPLAMGPLLAAAIAVATYDLAGRVSASLAMRGSAPQPPRARLAPLHSASLGLEPATMTARTALSLSVVCAALRYHTADTMSHGLAALCFTAALALLFRAADASTIGRARLLGAGAGLAAGWLLAARPVSAVALGATLAFALARDEAARGRRLQLGLAMALGAAPMVALLVAHQHAATGAWGVSSQRLYYAASDGPPDCFRYGFGHGVGCLGEHAEFVQARLPGGYGLLAALGTTLRRLKLHLVDPLNIEPLAVLVAAGGYVARGRTRGRALGLAVVAQVVAYAPFYFDGNYPGGGARLFCDLLPIEHVLAAVAAAQFALRRAGGGERWLAGLIALALAGFAFRAGFDHAALRDREGGRPFFEPAVLARAGVARGLLFIDTDHGFDLAFDPARRSDLDVVRWHGDALDRVAWEERGRPAAFRYRYEIPQEGGVATVAVEPVVFAELDASHPLVIEGESLWPPATQRGGWALPEWAAGTCASAGRWLAVEKVHPAEDRASIQLALPAAWLKGRALRARVAMRAGSRGAVEIAGRREAFRAPASATTVCVELPSIDVPPSGEPLLMTLTVEPGGRVALDAVEVVF
jgi:hypothetical protein